MLLNGVYPLLSVIWILSTKIPNAIIYTNIKSAFIKIMGLWEKKREKRKSKANYILRSIILHSKNMNIPILAGERLLLFFLYSNNFLKIFQIKSTARVKLPKTMLIHYFYKWTDT